MHRVSYRVAFFAYISLFLLSGCGTATTGGQHVLATPTYATTYIAIGASDAYGVGTDDPDSQSWPSVLARTLSSQTHLINLGIPQATVAVATAVELPIATQTPAQIITVWLALNDYEVHLDLASYRQQLGALLASLRSQTHAAIFVGNMPDLTLLPFFAKEDRTQLRDDVTAWNAAIAAEVAAHGATLVDIKAGFAVVAIHPEYLSSDGLHPSPSGARQLASVFAAAIKASRAG